MEYYPELLNIYKITLDEYDKKCSMPEGKMLVLPFPAKEIRALVNEIDRLTKLHEWIPVTERLPEEDLPVLGTFAGKPAVDTCCYADGKWWQVGHEILVTHWQPLPLPPQEQP